MSTRGAASPTSPSSRGSTSSSGTAGPVAPTHTLDNPPRPSPGPYAMVHIAIRSITYRRPATTNNATSPTRVTALAENRFWPHSTALLQHHCQGGRAQRARLLGGTRTILYCPRAARDGRGHHHRPVASLCLPV